MPLIICCGFPSSGKSTVCRKLEEFFHQQQKSVTVISDGDDFNKNEVYGNSGKEKSARGALKSQVERHLSRDSVLILDSLNYIKGFRYELHCLVKAHKTLHCVVHCASPVERCSEWNTARDCNQAYTKDILDALVMRFETPESRCRWDNPLFTVFDHSDTPFDAIAASLFDRKAIPPNQSTMPTPLSSTNYMHELDRISQDIVTSIFDRQKTAVVGETIVVDGTMNEKVFLARSLTMADLRRLKRQFLTYTKMHPVEDTTKIGTMFVKFINNQIKVE